MVKRGLAATSADARDLIGSGRVLVAGSVAHTANRQVSPAEALVVASPPARFVGRGGEKLEAALARFDLSVAGLRIIDVGASCCSVVRAKWWPSTSATDSCTNGCVPIPG